MRQVLQQITCFLPLALTFFSISQVDGIGIIANGLFRYDDTSLC